jgi:hypothetical protein
VHKVRPNAHPDSEVSKGYIAAAMWTVGAVGGNGADMVNKRQRIAPFMSAMAQQSDCALRSWHQGSHQAGFEFLPQPRAIEIASDQHELVRRPVAAWSLVEREALSDEVKDVTLAVLGDPQQAFAAVDIVGKGLQEPLKPVHPEGPIALEGHGLETIGGDVIVGRACCSLTRRAVTGRTLKKSIGLKQAHAQDERERNLASGGI